MEIAFAIALPGFIAGIFYLALWLQWQPGWNCWVSGRPDVSCRVDLWA